MRGLGDANLAAKDNPGVVADDANTATFLRLTRAAGSGVQTTLFCALKSRARLPIGKPIAFVSNRKVLLAPPANRLSRWSNAVADDFVNRLAARAEIKKVGHCPQMGGTLFWKRPAPSRLENASAFYHPPTTNRPSTRSR